MIRTHYSADNRILMKFRPTACVCVFFLSFGSNFYLLYFSYIRISVLCHVYNPLFPTGFFFQLLFFLCATSKKVYICMHLQNVYGYMLGDDE